MCRPPANRSSADTSALRADTLLTATRLSSSFTVAVIAIPGTPCPSRSTRSLLRSGPRVPVDAGRCLRRTAGHRRPVTAGRRPRPATPTACRVVPRGSRDGDVVQIQPRPEPCAADASRCGSATEARSASTESTRRSGACAESTSRCCSGENPSVSPGCGGQVQHHQPVARGWPMMRRGHVGQQQVRQHAGEPGPGPEGDQVGVAIAASASGQAGASAGSRATLRTWPGVVATAT